MKKRVLTPQAIMNMTVGELMADPNLEVHKQGSVLTFNTPEGIITIQPRTRPATLAAPKRGRKKAAAPAAEAEPRKRKRLSKVNSLEPKIKALRAEGKKQSEIAAILQKSQSYISTIERKMRDRDKAIAEMETEQAAAAASNSAE